MQLHLTDLEWKGRNVSLRKHILKQITHARETQDTLHTDTWNELNQSKLLWIVPVKPKNPPQSARQNEMDTVAHFTSRKATEEVLSNSRNPHKKTSALVRYIIYFSKFASPLLAEL